MDAHKNLAISTVATAPSPAISGTSLTVQTGHGARFPAVSFNATVCAANTFPDPTNSEIVRVTAISTDTFTIRRSQETAAGGPAARPIVVGDQIFASMTVRTLQDVETTATATLAALTAGVAGNGVESSVATSLAVTWVSGMTVKVAAGVARIAGARWSYLDTFLAAAMNGLSLPRATITVDATEGFLVAPTTSQPLIVVTSSGAQVVRYTSIASGMVLNTNVADGVGTMSTGGNVSPGFTIAPADANLDRIDVVLANNTGYLSLTTGMPATTPLVPAIPSTSVVLAQIFIGAGVSVLSADVITDARVLLPTLNTAMSFTPDNTAAMKQWRRSLSTIKDYPVDVLWGPGDSINEGYYNSDDFHRHFYLTTKRLQQFYNPPGVPGGEGYIPFLHYVGGLFAAAAAPTGCVNLPQRWTTIGFALPLILTSIGLAQRGGYLTAGSHLAVLPFYGDRCWIHYRQHVVAHFMGYAFDATVTAVTTLGALTGTGTGTCTVSYIYSFVFPALPTGSFTLTVDDEDMTCTVAAAGQAAGATTAVVTISARGVNGTTAVAHAGTPYAIWASGGLLRQDTNATNKSGRFVDSGALARDVHTVTVIAINRAAAGYQVYLEGATIFDGDGGQAQSTFTDGVTNGTTTVTSATANFSTAKHAGRAISGLDIPPNTTIASVTNATTVVLSIAAIGSHSGVTFQLGGNGTGIRCWDGNRSTTNSADWVGPVGTVQGYWAECLDVVDPDLCIIELGINDLQNAGLAELVYKTNLTSIVALIRAQAPSNPSIVFQLPYRPGGFTAAQWNAFINGVNGAALALGCGVWDLTDKLPAAPAVGGDDLFANYLHPTDSLSIDMSQQFAFYLGIPDSPASTLLRPFNIGGDGSDGTVIFDGAATVLGLVPAANVYMLTQDIFVRDLTVKTGVTINPVNFRIFCAGTLINNGRISNDGAVGGNAVVGTPGAAGAVTALQTLAATLAGGIGGAIAGAGANGAAAVAADGPILGGNGGTGGAAGGAGGTGGATANTANINSAHQLYSLMTGSAVSAASTGKILFLKGGQGGGGGGGQALTNAGGGGGSGGGIVLICAQTIVNNGTISASGGNGGTAPGTAAGGGGGGGGVVILVTSFLQTFGTVLVNGGLPGLGGAGTPTAGARGTIILQRN